MQTVHITAQAVQNCAVPDVGYFLREVCQALTSDTIILFEEGFTAKIRETYLPEAFFFMSNNDGSLKPCAFLLENVENITIDGNGAELDFVGRVVPFFLNHCKNVTIKNFKLDYVRPFTSQGEVLYADENRAVLAVDKTLYPYTIHHDIAVFTGENYQSNYVHGMLEFYKEPKRPVINAFDNLVRGALHDRETEDGHLEILHHFDFVPTVGNILTIKHEHRLISAININACEDVFIDHVHLKQSGSMGIIAQLTKNIYINKFEVYSDSERVFTLNADATHFVNCCGEIKMTHSRLEGMFDDAINVHGNHLLIDTVLDAQTVIVQLPHFQQVGLMNMFPGNHVIISDKKTMQKHFDATIDHVEIFNKKYAKLFLKEAIPFAKDGLYCLDNMDLHPKVTVQHNFFGKNRARGILLTTTKEVLVENNVFDCEGTCILVNSDMFDWFESGAMSKIIVKNNTLVRQNQVNWGKGLIDIDPRMEKEMEGVYYHGILVLEDNTATLQQTPFVYGFSFTKALIHNNTVHLTTPEYTPVFSIRNCGEVDLQNNHILKEE